MPPAVRRTVGFTTTAEDFAVEYRLVGSPAAKSWCVLKGATILTVAGSLDAALAAARQMAGVNGSAAWLMVAHQDFPISLSQTL
jgi:hypothetical protein